MKRQIHGREENKKFRRALRSAPTTAEGVLWSGLRRRQLCGRRFRRQHSIGPYVVDFYCPAERLVVEVDGGVHERTERGDYDLARTRYLESLGLRILRFTNEAVLHHGDDVLEMICEQFSEEC